MIAPLRLPSLLLALALVSGPAGAVDLPDRSWMLGVGAGVGNLYGGSRLHMGRPYIATGSIMYTPIEDHSWAFEVDRLMFQKKRDNRVDATALTFVARGFLANKNREVVPYALLGVGYSETQADLGPAGGDRGSGAALSLGAGFFKAKDSPLSWGTEVRFLRLASPLSRLGLGGISMIALTARATFRLGSYRDPFAR